MKKNRPAKRHVSLFLGQTDLLNPLTILCTVVVLIFAILAGAEYKDLVKKNK